MGDAREIAERIIRDQARYLGTVKAVDELEQRFEREEDREIVEQVDADLARELYPRLREQAPLQTPRRPGRPSIADPEEVGYMFRETPEMRRREDIDMDNIIIEQEEIEERGRRTSRQRRGLRIRNPDDIVRVGTQGLENEIRADIAREEAEEISFVDRAREMFKPVQTFGAVALGVGATAVAIQTANNLRGRRQRLPDNLQEGTEERIRTHAKMIKQIYQNRKDAGVDTPVAIGRRNPEDIKGEGTVIDGYTLEDTRDLTGLFVNKDKKEFILAIRGIDPVSNRDRTELAVMGAYSMLPLAKSGYYGQQFALDKREIDNAYADAKNKYPDFKPIVIGHSRGGQGSLYLGRGAGIETHAYNPASSAMEYWTRRKVKPFSNDINIYYTDTDVIPSNIKHSAGRTGEKHYRIDENPSLRDGAFGTLFGQGHSIDHFLQDDLMGHEHTFIPSRPAVPRGQFRDIAVGDTEFVFDAEDLVRADLGLFDDEEEKEEEAVIELNEEQPSVAGSRIVKETLQTFAPRAFRPQTRAIDKNGDGFISKTELKDFLKDRFTDDEIERIFNELDVDNDGKIDSREAIGISQYL